MQQRDSKQLIQTFQIQYSIYDRKSTSHEFDTPFQYYISMIGITVGFGSFWRFPYTMYENGGGAFLVPYTISFILFGIPMLYLEMAVGHMHKLSVPFILERIHKGLKVVGISICLITLWIISFYNLLLTYCYRYLFTAFTYPLPYAQQSPEQARYLQEEVLEKSSSIFEYGGLSGFLYFIYVGSIIILYFIIKKGVKSSGKIAIYTALSPYIFFIILLLKGLTLPGGYEGFLLCLTPNLDKIYDPSVWITAFVQAFFQLNVGCGVIINLTSLKPKSQSCLKGVYIIPIFVYLCGILCAACVYMFVNYEAKMMGVEFEDLSLSGLQLSFNVFPKALSTLPLPNLWVFLFYLTMVCLGIDSLFGGVEALICYVMDQIRINKQNFMILGYQLHLHHIKKSIILVFAVFGIFYCSHAGIHYLQFVNKFLIILPITISVLIQYIIFVRIFPLEELIIQQKQHTGKQAPSWIIWMLKSKIMLVFLLFNLVLSIIAEFKYIIEYYFVFSVLGVAIGLGVYVIAYLQYKKNRGRQWKLSFDQIKKQYIERY